MIKSVVNKIGAVSLFFVLVLSSCGVSLVASYDREMSLQIDQTAKRVDLFYLNMLEKTKDPADRKYSLFIDDYIAIEVELNSLYTRSRIKPLNKLSTRNFEIAVGAWRDYKAEHKRKNMLGDLTIGFNRTYMNDLFYAVRVGEAAKPN